MARLPEVSGINMTIIDFGTEKGRKFLAMEGRLHGSEKLKSEVLNSIQGLDHPSGYPNWHWYGSIKVLKQIEHVFLLKGLGKRFNDHLQEIRESSARWNLATSR